MRFSLLLFICFPILIFAQTQVNPIGNGNSTVICQPKITITPVSCTSPKIVYRTKIKYKTRIIHTKPKTIIKRIKVVKRIILKRRPKKNRIKLLGGYGSTGVSANQLGNKAIAYEAKGMVLGLGYDRSLNSKFSIGAQALTNATFLLNVGFDF